MQYRFTFKTPKCIVPPYNINPISITDSNLNQILYISSNCELKVESRKHFENVRAILFNIKLVKYS